MCSSRSKKLLMVAVVACAVAAAPKAEAAVTVFWDYVIDTAQYFGPVGGPGVLMPEDSTWNVAFVALSAGDHSTVGSHATAWEAGGNSGGLVTGSDTVLDTQTWSGIGTGAGLSGVDATAVAGSQGYFVLYEGASLAASSYFGYLYADAWDIPSDPGAAGAQVTFTPDFGGGGNPDAPSGTMIAGQSSNWAAVAPSAIPEPGTFALFALGLSALGLRRKMTK